MPSGETGEATGSWAEEVASPYYLFKAAGYTVDITSIAGGEIPFGEYLVGGRAVPPSPSCVQVLSQAHACLKGRVNGILLMVRVSNNPVKSVVNQVAPAFVG